MKKDISVKLSNIFVEGIDSTKRISSIRSLLFLGRKSESLSLPILNNISFTAVAGDRIGIIGRNGSGKSSLLKTIAGIYPVKSGFVETRGKIAPLIEMGVSFEPNFSGRINIKIALCYAGRISDYSKELEQQIIDFTELEGKIDLPLKNYSSGMIARLAFAISIFQKPDILLLDEVLATGDSGFIQKSYQAMSEKISNASITFIVQHSTQTIQQLCNKCIYIKDGFLVKMGSVTEIIELYQQDT